ncbi:MAG TPA: vWA domain-containing protein [Polyangiaceae bacterium]
MKTYLPLLLILAFACSESKKNRRGDSDAGEGGEGVTTSGGSGNAPASGGTGGSSSTAGGTGGTSAEGGTTSSGATGGSDPTAGTGSGATGGDTNQGGEGSGGESTPGSGGTGGGADGGTGLVSGGDGGTSGNPPMGGTPVVELLLDGSSSMFENQGWAQAYEALITSGTLEAFEGKLELGLALFQGSDMLVATSEDDPACATITGVDFSTMGTTAIQEALDGVAATWNVMVKWETPTGHALRRATDALAAVEASEGTRKYILLVTDGEPNTCTVLDPQCGQDNLIKATQDARAAGIRTVVVGLGDLAAGISSCPTYARCGNDHLQDIANAGAGLAVEPPSEEYLFAPCNPNFEISASYAGVGGGGDARFYTSANPDGLVAELTAALQSMVDGTVP